VSYRGLHPMSSHLHSRVYSWRVKAFSSLVETSFPGVRYECTWSALNPKSANFTTTLSRNCSLASTFFPLFSLPLPPLTSLRFPSPTSTSDSPHNNSRQSLREIETQRVRKCASLSLYWPILFSPFLPFLSDLPRLFLGFCY
jgi:hypothetical protein